MYDQALWVMWKENGKGRAYQDLWLIPSPLYDIERDQFVTRTMIAMAAISGVTIQDCYCLPLSSALHRS